MKVEPRPEITSYNPGQPSFSDSKTLSYPLLRAYNSNLPSGRGEIDDESAGMRSSSSISTDFLKAARIRDHFYNASIVVETFTN